MKGQFSILLAITAILVIPLPATAAIPLGTAGNFAVLAGSTVTNTGPTVIDGGSVGVSPGSAITGFPPGSVVRSRSTIRTTRMHNLCFRSGAR